MEQRRLFQGYSPPNISRVKPFENFYDIHAITSVGQSVRSEKNLSEISKNSVRFFLGAVFCHTK